MLIEARLLPEMIKSWRDNRAPLYSFIATVAGALVVANVATGLRPVESLALATRGFGLVSITEWLTRPALAAVQSSGLSKLLLTLAGFLFIMMILVPLIQGIRGYEDLYTDRFVRLVGSPSACTVWVLLAVAAQLGDIIQPLLRWGRPALMSAIGIGGVFVIARTIFVVASCFSSEDHARETLRVPIDLIGRLFSGLGMALFAVLFAAGGVPFSIAAWSISMQSDRSREVEASLAVEQWERRKPTGALFPEESPNEEGARASTAGFRSRTVDWSGRTYPLEECRCGARDVDREPSRM